MPELPEVETVMRGLAPLIVGRRIARAIVRRRDLRAPIPSDFARRVAGCRITALRRRAKYILIELDSGDTVVVHLGMSGRLVVQRQASAPAKHDHVDFDFAEAGIVRFTDPRRFGLIDLVRREALACDPRFATLGPEPLGEAFTGAALAARLADKRTPIKAALLDQHVVAGLGNIYVCEALFQSGISPRRRAAAIAPDRIERLAAAIREVLTRAIEAGGSSARDYVQASGELGWFQHQWAVYDREGRPCLGCDCAGAVKRMVQSGRSTFYCATRQR